MEPNLHGNEGATPAQLPCCAVLDEHMMNTRWIEKHAASSSGCPPIAMDGARMPRHVACVRACAWRQVRLRTGSWVKSRETRHYLNLLYLFEVVTSELGPWMGPWTLDPGLVQ